MGLSKVSGSFIASALALTTAVAPAMIQETAVEAATKGKLTKTEVELVVGESTKVKLKGAKAVKFESTNSKIAKVSKSGKIKAKKAGSCTIKVTDEKGKVYKCKVTVAKKTKTNDNGKGNGKATGDIDLGGMEIIIRDWWSPGLDEKYPADPVNEYEEARNEYRKEVMEKYNFTMREAAISDWGGASLDFVDYTMMGGDENNYIFTLHNDEVVSNAMAQGMMYDLSKLDCLDFGAEKFSRNKLHEKYSMGSSIYAMFAGYAEPRNGVYFNKQVLEDAGIDPDSIYEAQKKGTWTWDMFDELMDKCQRDTDGDGEDDIFGLTLNEGIMITAAVYSNGGSYVSKDKKGKYVYNLESPETMEALQWCVDMFTKYDQHDPEGANWDYYMEEFSSGKVAFCVDQEYMGTYTDFGICTGDFDIGFVMFPKGPRAKDYINIWDDNAYVIPACYDADRAWKIAFAWNVWTNPAPGFEDYNEYAEVAKNGKFDARAIKETIPMMADKSRGTVTYHDIITGIEIGPDLTWNIIADTDINEVIEKNCRDKWNECIDEVNKYIAKKK